MILHCTKGVFAGRDLIGVVCPGHQIPMLGKMSRKIIRLNGNN
jgi:hypothetical protein